MSQCCPVSFCECSGCLSSCDRICIRIGQEGYIGFLKINANVCPRCSGGGTISISFTADQPDQSFTFTASISSSSPPFCSINSTAMFINVVTIGKLTFGGVTTDAFIDLLFGINNKVTSYSFVIDNLVGVSITADVPNASGNAQVCCCN